MDGRSEQAAGTTPGADDVPKPEAPPRAPVDETGAGERDKAEPEKAAREVEAGDVADDLADFA